MPIDESERNRRRALLHEHYAAENNHDLEAIMKTFSADGVMLFNRQAFPSDDAIRWAHGYMGMTAAPGAISGLCAHIDDEHFTDEEVVVEGRLTGQHSREFLGFSPTDREVELPFVAFYRFDAGGKLTSERVVMNLGPLQTSSGLKERFVAAAADAKDLAEAQGNDVKLEMYGLFKQASAGDVTGSRPGFTDRVGRGKYDAWAALKGISTGEAMQRYIDLIESLKSR